MTLKRALRRQVIKESAFLKTERLIQGWKLVHGDVFRPPFNNRLFAAVIGSGIQVLVSLLTNVPNPNILA